ncbi:MAG: hypothetical protein M1834_000701 [Cirrosporium novae-zelandiae]|nr:MAG: hypothetical protein M1834_000701 [Cirrosporium novae-zelandiae]
MRMTKKMKSLRATLEVKDDGETVKLTVPFSEKSSVKKDIARIKLPLMDITGGWQPAEHVFLTVPSLSWKHVIQAHPFTIATQVPNPRDSDVGLELLIRAQDGFSKDLLTFAKSHNSVQVWLDGPYGSQSLIDILGTSDLAIFVAGGSGISVTWPLLGAFLESRADDVEGERATLHRKKALFVWIVNKKSHLSWMEKDALHAMQDRGVEIVIPEPTSEKGRPAIPELITSWIQKTEHEILGAPAELAVVGCGPEIFWSYELKIGV